MSQVSLYRRPPKGRPAIGFQLEVPREMEMRDGPVSGWREVQHGGRTVGEIEIRVFGAALVIDRDGILAEKACAELRREAAVAGDSPAVAVQLPGAAGYRADAVQRTDLPYRHAFAVAPDDLGVEGGVLITIRSAKPDWPAGEHMLRTLRFTNRAGTVVANDDHQAAAALPMVAPRR